MSVAKAGHNLPEGRFLPGVGCGPVLLRPRFPAAWRGAERLPFADLHQTLFHQGRQDGPDIPQAAAERRDGNPVSAARRRDRLQDEALPWGQDRDNGGLYPERRFFLFRPDVLAPREDFVQGLP